MNEERDEFMHVGADGRIVHFVHTDPISERLIPMMLWSERLEANRYRIAFRPGQEGWTVGMVPTTNGMRIEREGKQFDLRPAAAAAAESECPEWYAQRLRKALTRMSEREAEVKAAGQADASDGENASI